MQGKKQTGTFCEKIKAKFAATRKSAKKWEAACKGVTERESIGYRILESFGLEKTSKIIEPNNQPHAAKPTTKPHSYEPHLHIF